MKGLVTGSFDPITLGHTDLIERARSMCDSLVVAVFNNEQKSYMFDLDRRVELVRIALSGTDINVYGSEGYVVDFCKDYGIDIIIRGFRTAADYVYETEMAIYNYSHGGVRTYLLPTDSRFECVSGSAARKRIESGKDLADFLPDSIIAAIRRSL